jgi:xanthine/CO dehydrogenase XdhC/CoxF family maturation factor
MAYMLCTLFRVRGPPERMAGRFFVARQEHTVSLIIGGRRESVEFAPDERSAACL